MPITQKVIISASDLNGNAVQFDQSTMKNVIRAEGVDGKTVYVDSAVEPYDVDAKISVVFDDLTDPKPTLEWDQSSVPDAAWHTVNIGFFDNTKLVFSSVAAAIEYLQQMPPLKSPREKREA
jgi:hypothetical protein